MASNERSPRSLVFPKLCVVLKATFYRFYPQFCAEKRTVYSEKGGGRFVLKTFLKRINMIINVKEINHSYLIIYHICLHKFDKCFMSL